MARSLAFGNGQVLVATDRFGQLRDLFFPYVGLENHVGGQYAHRVGVWVENNFSWLDDGSWQMNIRADDAYTGLTTAHSVILGIEIHITDVLSHDKNIFLRKFKVQNLLDRDRDIRIFFNHQFEIYHSEKGDTAFYDTATKSIIHYEGQRAFLMNAYEGKRGMDDFTVGIFQLEGKDGTYKDAEDGLLAKNPIEHGRVDSTIGMHLFIPKGSVKTFHYWLCMGRSVEEARDMDEFILKHTPDAVIKSSRDYWHAWLLRNTWDFYGLGENVKELFNRSQLYLRSHVGDNGAIIASCDSDMLQGGRDTYAYVWPRDAAYVAVTLDWLGDRHSARKFFEFCNDAIGKDGYLMHKYRSDGSLGSSWHGWLVDGHPELPIQEDETALILWALWEHWLATKDLDFIESIYDSFITKAGVFLATYRNPYTGLPRPSYNLWEEKFGIHTYTTASVYGGLLAAGKFSKLLGRDRNEHNFEHIAEEMKSAIMKHLYNEETGAFYKSLIVDQKGEMTPDRTLDASSAYGIFIFGVLPPDDERLLRAIALTKEALTIRTPVGGIARYSGDQYFRRSSDQPGNPWYITTLWYTQHAIAIAKNDNDLEKVRADLNWVERSAERSGILSEQIDPHTREQTSAAPLTWSHAEYIRTIIMYMRKVASLGLSSGSSSR